MWGYAYVAGVLDAGLAFFGRWLSFVAALTVTLFVFAIAVNCLKLPLDKLHAAVFPPARQGPSALRWRHLENVSDLLQILLVGWLSVCAFLWIFNQTPPATGAGTSIGSLLVILLVSGISFFLWERIAGAPAKRLRWPLLFCLIAVVVLVLLWGSFPYQTINFITWVAAILLVGSPVVAFVLWRFRRPQSLADEPFRRSNARAGQPWPPLGPPEFTTYGDAQLADPAIHERAMKDLLGGSKGIWFGLVQGSDREASYVGDRHLLTVAPNRTGKGTCTIIPNLLIDEEHSIICIDPKGQNAAVTARARRTGGRPVCCLNPFGEHTGAPWHLPMHGFNPLAGMSIDDPNVVADVAALAEAIIITESKTNPYFENSARDLIEVLILHALAIHGKNATLAHMRGWLGQPMTAPYGKPSLLLTLTDIQESKYPFIREMAARFLSDTKSVDEIVQSATNQTKFLSHPVIATCLSGNDFRMIDFKNHRGTLYVILPERYLDAYSRFLRLVVVSALNALRSRPGGVKTIIMMDEFARLGPLAAVEQAVGSSAGFNVQLWPFVQDLNQLQHLYPQRWDSFIANAGVVQWFTPNDSTTARYLSSRVGKTTVTNTTLNRQANTGQTAGSTPGRSIGQSTSSNESDLGVDFLSPQNLYDMPQGLQLLTLAGLSYPVCATREPYYAVSGLMGEALKQRAEPDPFHM